MNAPGHDFLPGRRQEVRAELRAVAALSNVELITALLSCNGQLALVGLQLRIVSGVVSLLTTEVHNKALAAYSEQKAANGNSGLTTGTLEVLACIAFKQPIIQAEIDRIFNADKPWLMWNVVPDLTEIVANRPPSHAVQGVNDFGRSKYSGPCPPPGIHRYYFKLYALDTTLALPPTSKRRALNSAIKGHIIAEPTLMGRYARKGSKS